MAIDGQSSSDITSAAMDEKLNWCNFCGYSSDSLDDYLAHSCVEVLEAKGQKIVSTGQNECR
jgi:hypothetical protein